MNGGVTALRPVGVAAAVALVLLSAGCKKKRYAEISKFGPWDLTSTTLGQVTGGHCDPTKLPDGRLGIWCYALPGLKIGSQPGQIDAYFSDGTERANRMGDAANLASPLIELQLNVRSCNVIDVDRWLRDRLGIPLESGAGLARWENSKILVVAELPNADAACLVRIFPQAEKPEFERVMTKLNAAHSSQ